MDVSRFFSALRTSTPRVLSFEKATILPQDAVIVGRAAPKSSPPSILVLDNKAQGKRTATELVATADDAFFDTWPVWSRRPLEPNDALADLTLVVEDASPDSVWAIIALLARVATCDLQPVLAAWLPSIVRWETGGIVDDVRSEWTSLASALGHANYGRDRADRHDGFPDAWQRVIRFAAETVARKQSPTKITPVDDWPLLAEAKVALEQERQTYEDWLTHARVTQLSIPIIGHNDRRVLVDGLFFVEDDVTGAAKLFYRNDCASSPLGRGYTFAASFRPGAPPGSDFTITVDPRSGIELRLLWKELESRETEAWSHLRPDWAPRSERLGKFNQPWWIDEGGTLIGAPRAVESTQGDPSSIGPGSKLTWDQIQDAIWAVYNPLKDVKVRSYPSGELVSLDRFPIDSVHTASAKRVLLATWPNDLVEAMTAPRSLTSAPVVDRVIAGGIALKGEAALTFHDLPHEHDYHRIPLSGGFALITAAGVFVLDDWRETSKLEMEAIRRVCNGARDFDETLTSLEKERIPPLSDEIQELLKKGSLRKERSHLVTKAALVLVELAELRVRSASVPASADARLLSEKLADAWALHQRLDAMERQMKAIADSSKALGDAQMRRLTQLVAFVGFPYYVASGLAKPLADAADEAFRAARMHGLWIAKDGKDPTNVVWWLSFLLLFALGIGTAFAATGRWKRRKPTTA